MLSRLVGVLQQLTQVRLCPFGAFGGLAGSPAAIGDRLVGIIGGPGGALGGLADVLEAAARFFQGPAVSGSRALQRLARRSHLVFWAKAGRLAAARRGLQIIGQLVEQPAQGSDFIRHGPILALIFHLVTACGDPSR